MNDLPSDCTKLTLDATGAVIDRFTLNIKAAIWREENKRRAERMRMGKIGTLKDRRWPGQYDKFGYATVKEPGKRGCIITLAEVLRNQSGNR